MMESLQSGWQRERIAKIADYISRACKCGVALVKVL
jgi:hypothetical protein